MHRALLALALPLVLVACGGEPPSDEVVTGEPRPTETFGAPVVDEDAAKKGAEQGALATFDPSVDPDSAPEQQAPTTPPTTPTTPTTPPTTPTTPPTPPTTPPTTPPSSGNPGPAPTQTCTVQKDANGFFVRSSGKSDYVAYVPASYSASTPMRVVVGMHGCGDDALNFAKWAVNPWATRATQTHIGISVGGESGNGKCWSIGGDDAKVLAAVDDLAKCFWVNKSKVTVAGFSSGGQLAYRVGLMNASRFAGILIENSGLYAADSNPDGLLANASRKLPIAHRARTSDSVFPIAKVKTDWQKTGAAGFPLETSEIAGGHDGSGDDWSGWLLGKSAGWTSP